MRASGPRRCVAAAHELGLECEVGQRRLRGGIGRGGDRGPASGGPPVRRRVRGQRHYGDRRAAGPARGRLPGPGGGCGGRFRRHSARAPPRPDDRPRADRRAWRAGARSRSSPTSSENGRRRASFTRPCWSSVDNRPERTMIALDRRQLLTGSALLLGGATMPRWAGAAAADASRLLRRHRAADLPLVLGHGEPKERACPGPLADPELFEHRRGRLRASGLCHRRRARLVHASARRAT